MRRGLLHLELPSRARGPRETEEADMKRFDQHADLPCFRADVQAA